MNSGLLCNMDKTGLKVNPREGFVPGVESGAFFGGIQYFADTIIIHDFLPFGGQATLNDPLDNDSCQG